MNSDRLADYLGHIRLAAEDARRFVRGMDKATFEGDIRTQRAVVMSLIIVGEAATKVMDQFPDFTTAHPEVPWPGYAGRVQGAVHALPPSGEHACSAATSASTRIGLVT